MKKYVIGVITLLTLLLSSITVFASEEYNISTESPISIYKSSNSLDEDVIDILPLYPTDAFVPATTNGATFFSVPKKIVVTSTTRRIDYSKVLAKSPIVNKGMTATVAYSKSLSASFNCSASVGTDIISAGVGFNVSTTYQTTGSASQIATSRGYLVLVPEYKVVNFNIYSGSRRPIGRQNWVLIGKGTAQKPENLFAVWKNSY
jgi:hypothetical protein